MKSVVSFFAILFAMESCKQTGTDIVYEIKEMISPATDSSAEPSLFTDRTGFYASLIICGNRDAVLHRK